ALREAPPCGTPVGFAVRHIMRTPEPGGGSGKVDDSELRFARVRSFALILATAAAATTIGCGAYVQHGETLYHEGHYIEAAEVFELTEDRLREASLGERAEYGVYRGLTFLRLDDVDNARRWLGYAYALERRDPDALRSYEQSLLARGWAEVEQRSA